jgi:hypothetical protein
MCFQWEKEEEKQCMMPKQTVSQIRLDTGPKFFFFQFQVFLSKVWMVPVLLSMLRARSLHPTIASLDFRCENISRDCTDFNFFCIIWALLVSIESY